MLKMMKNKTLLSPLNLKRKLEEKQFDTLVITGRYALESIASILALDINQLRHDNPGMNKVLATGKSYELKLPKGMLEKFEAHKNEILQASLNALYQLN